MTVLSTESGLQQAESSHCFKGRNPPSHVRPLDAGANLLSGCSFPHSVALDRTLMSAQIVRQNGVRSRSFVSLALLLVRLLGGTFEHRQNPPRQGRGRRPRGCLPSSAPSAALAASSRCLAAAIRDAAVAAGSPGAPAVQANGDVIMATERNTSGRIRCDSQRPIQAQAHPGPDWYDGSQRAQLAQRGSRFERLGASCCAWYTIVEY
jgi:hypothetical protein